MVIFHSVGNVIIPTDRLNHFCRGVGQPPTSKKIMVDVDDQYPGIPSSVIQRGWKKSPKKTTNQIMKP